MARVGQTHAQASQARLRAGKQLNANGPIAPQILAPQPAWCAKRAARAIADPRPCPANPHFRMEFAGLPWDLIRTCDTPVQELEKSAALAAPKAVRLLIS
jgi:hypothetical protein